MLDNILDMDLGLGRSVRVMYGFGGSWGVGLCAGYLHIGLSCSEKNVRSGGLRGWRGRRLRGGVIDTCTLPVAVAFVIPASDESQG